MEIFRKIDELKYDKNTVVTIGTFDGVHLAHRQIINRVKEIASAHKNRSLIITFDPHPQEVLKTKTPDIKLLNTIDEKLEAFEKLGIDSVYIINFTFEFSKTAATDFYEKYLVGAAGISHLVVGFDHLFGRNREGDINTLYELGKKYDFEVHKVEEIDVDGEKVSSTRIRNHLKEGEIEKVNALLGYQYGFTGKVIVGDRRGRTLGFPTANVEPVTKNKALPGNGVYVVQVEISGRKYQAMMNMGYRPTLTNAINYVMEANIFEFDEDIYGQTIKIKFLSKLRNEQKFGSKDELLSQLNKDKINSLNYFKSQI